MTHGLTDSLNRPGAENRASENCEKWLAFLAEIFPDQEDRRLAQQELGKALSESHIASFRDLSRLILQPQEPDSPSREGRKSNMTQIQRTGRGNEGEESNGSGIQTAWEQFLDQALGGDKGAISFIQEFLGSCLARDIWFPGLILIGDEMTRNMVSQVFNTFLHGVCVESVLGDHMFVRDLGEPLILGFLPGKALVEVFQEGWKKERYSVNLKRLITGELMDVEREYGSRSSHAFDCRVVIHAKKDIPEGKAGGLRRMTRTVKLHPAGVVYGTSYDSSEIRLWALAGLKRFLERGGFLGSSSHSEKQALGPLDVEAYLNHYGVKIFDVKNRGNGVWFHLEQCVFDPSHVNGEAAILQSQQAPYLDYHCIHGACKNRRWKDARLKISGNESLRMFCEGVGISRQGSHSNG